MSTVGDGTRPRAYSYVRFSTPEQAKGDSSRRQKDASSKYAAEHNLDLVEDGDDTLKDLGVSAFKGKNVKSGALGRFLEAVRGGEVPRGSYLLVESLDRVSRQSPYDAADTMRDIVSEGVTVVDLLDGGRVYNEKILQEDSMAFIMMAVGFMRAHEESQRKAERLSAAWAKKRRSARDRPLTAMCPAWLELKDGKYEPIKDRAKIIKRIFDEAAAGIGIPTITRRLNEERVPHFGKSNGWHSSYITKILKNRAVIGEFQPRSKRKPDGNPIPGYYGHPVISEDLFDRVQRGLAQRRNHGPERIGHGAGAKGRDYNNLFSGLATCAYCGGKVKFENKGPGPKGGAYLICDSVKRGLECPATRWRYDHFEKSVLAFVREVDLASVFRSDDEARQRQALDERIQTLDAKRDQLELKCKRLAEALADGASSKFVIDELAKNERELSEIETELAQNREVLAALVSEAADFNESKEQIRSLIDRLQIKNDPETYKLRSQVAAKLRALIKELVVAPDGSAPLLKNYSIKSTKTGDGSWTVSIEAMSPPKAQGHIPVWFDEETNATRSKMRYFYVKFKDGTTRAIFPNDKDPYKYDEQYYEADGISETDRYGKAE